MPPYLASQHCEPENGSALLDKRLIARHYPAEALASPKASRGG